MITSELISYIKKQIKNGLSKDLIILKLIQAGWHKEDAEEGFLNVELELNLEKPTSEINKEIKVFNPMKDFQDENSSQTELEVFNSELPKGEDPKKEPSKVWVPKSVPVIEVKKVEQQVIKNDFETKVEINKKIEPKEFIPTLTPKPVMNSFGSVKKENEVTPADLPVKDLSKMAMLASLPKDMFNIKNQNKKVEIPVKKKKSKLPIIILILIILIGLATFAFVSGFVNIKNFNIPFIKKDPRVLLLNNSTVLSALKSYKTETNVEIASPAFADISFGLISGEAVNSKDKETISINTLGTMSQNENGLSSDNFITIKGSILPNYVTADVKSDGSNLFVSIPDLSKVVKSKVPEPAVVKINEEQFSVVPSLFLDNIKLVLEKINLYKLLSSGMSSYINKDTLSVYDELISGVTIVEKGEETIKGISTYHYSISVDRELSKKLLTKISDNFVSNLSEIDRTNLQETIGTITINSFDVWIGKGDNNIYQYNAILSIPLSKILGLEDKSVGNNKVELNWKTTYYDFNVPNNIYISNDSIPIADFVKTAKEINDKNAVILFGNIATTLFNAEKGYGKKSNASGSCMNPSSGSLFSPVGHSKEATTAVSNVSDFLNKMLKKTNNFGYCYSTTKAWSFAVPIADSYESTVVGVPPVFDKYFCVDSTGQEQDLITPPSGVTCLSTAKPTIPVKQ